MQNDYSRLLIRDAQEGVLLSGRRMHTQRKAAAIIKQAQERAKKMVHTAQLEADSVASAAWQQGYENGLIAALDAVCLYLRETEAKVLENYRQLSADINQLLTGVFNADEAYLSAFEQWSQRIGEMSQEDGVHLLLPLRCRHLKPKLMAQWQDKHQAPLNIEFHAEGRFVMRYKEQLAEFSPDELTSLHSRRLLAKYSLDNQRSVALSQQAIASLQSVVNMQFITPSESSDDQ